MKTWYRAVCDEHKAMCMVFVSNPNCTADYLGYHSQSIQAWLEQHSNCSLRFVSRENELEPLLGVYNDNQPPEKYRIS